MKLDHQHNRNSTIHINCVDCQVFRANYIFMYKYILPNSSYNHMNSLETDGHLKQKMRGSR